MTGLDPQNLPLLIAVILAGLAFDFVNGFHDASNSIATIVATRVLKPRQAVLWAASFNFMALFFFGTGVAKMVGSGLVALDAVTPTVVLCGLVAATLWGLATWRLGLPSSSSHALLGGYAGAAIANNAFHKGWHAASDCIVASGWIGVLLFILLAPVIGLFLSYILMIITGRFKKRPKLYKRLQLISSAFLSMMHGSNDAQKTAGILASALLSAGALRSFSIPFWVLAMSYVTMGLGTLFGGWRIVKTMGFKLTRLQPQGGVCAESAAAMSIFIATLFGLPVSTTHVTTGAILGVGSAENPHKVRWKIGRHIAWAWILTIPASALIGGFVICAAKILQR